MTSLSLALVALSECCSIVGQIFFKIAMGSRWNRSRRKAIVVLGCGVAVMAVGFFIWNSLLGSLPLSLLYPFEGLNRIALLAMAGLFLKERITPALWLGVVLIGAGVMLVATS